MATNNKMVQIRAISELHSIEMSIFSLWKQLPDLDIVDKAKQIQQQQQREEEHVPPIFDIEDINGVEEIPEADKGLWPQSPHKHLRKWIYLNQVIRYRLVKAILVTGIF